MNHAVPPEALPRPQGQSRSRNSARTSMSQSFSHLNLRTEDFLRLQASARAYMLDDQHLERRSFATMRSGDDRHDGRLKMWRCAQQFLGDEGNGNTFFGAQHTTNDRSATQRQHVWPEDQDIIIQLIIPLLRRIITNERQRNYACRTRKQRKLKEQGKAGMNMSNERQTTELSIPGELEHHARSADSALGPDTPSTQLVATTKSPANYQPYLDYRWDLPDFTSHHQIPDVFQDGMIASASEAGDFYEQHNLQHDGFLDRLGNKTSLDNSEWFDLMTAVDGHMRYFHKSDRECPKACEDTYLRKITGMWAEQSAGGLKSVHQISQSIEAVRQAWEFLRKVLFEDGRAATAGTFLPPLEPQPYSFEGVALNVSVLQWGEQIMPSQMLPAGECLTLSMLISKVKQLLGAEPSSVAVVALLPNGLTGCDDDFVWRNALVHADVIDWMGKELKVILEIDEDISGSQFVET